MKYLIYISIIFISIWLLWSSEVRDKKTLQDYDTCMSQYKYYDNALPLKDYLTECLK